MTHLITANEKNMSNSLAHKIAGASSSNIGSGRSRLQNVAVNYMYRDASNYKCHETVIFENPRGVSVSELWRRINEALREVMLFEEQPIFRPEWVGLPTVFLFAQPGYSKNKDDHEWHELVEIEETDALPTLGEGSSICEFIEALRRTHKAMY